MEFENLHYYYDDSENESDVYAEEELQPPRDHRDDVFPYENLNDTTKCSLD